jgi:hypothetical protein
LKVPEGVEDHGNADEVIGGIAQAAEEPAGTDLRPPELGGDRVPKAEKDGGEKEEEDGVEHIGPEGQSFFYGLRATPSERSPTPTQEGRPVRARIMAAAVALTTPRTRRSMALKQRS